MGGEPDACLGAPEEDWSGAIPAGFRCWEAQERAQEGALRRARWPGTGEIAAVISNQ